jgi:salicylate hydroxylase
MPASVFQFSLAHLTSTEQDHGSTVSINFADGTTASANLVIAYDGIHSAIRSQFVVDKPTYSGRIAYRGLLPMSAVSSNWPYSSGTLSWLAPNKHFLVFPISKDRLLNVVGFVAKEESELDGLKESWKSLAPRAELEKEYEGWNETVQRIIQAMPSVVSLWKINDRELLSDWCYMDGKVILSGDSAHAMLPQQGKSSSFPSSLRHSTIYSSRRFLTF